MIFVLASSNKVLSVLGNAGDKTKGGTIILLSEILSPTGFVGTTVSEVATLSPTLTSNPYLSPETISIFSFEK